MSELDDTSSELPEYPIPVLSNVLVLKMMNSELIKIGSFDPKRLGPTSYQICPVSIRFHEEDEEGLLTRATVFRLDRGDTRLLRPGEYAIVSPAERIEVSQGIVVEFFPSSWCIENRLLLTMGRLDAGYNSDLVFGVFNAGRSDVELSPHLQIARASFAWLGASNMPVYEGKLPGAYIPQIQQLRARVEEMDLLEEDIRKKRASVKAELDRLTSGS